ncbi:MAG: metallophosphoesterase [Spirochaetes bacterium]|nr:metallophosphoesterase [Spirochaetota bacterium]
MMRIKKHLAICCIVTALILGYGLTIERYALRINTYPLHFENLPAAFNGYRILVITDLHYGRLMSKPWVSEIIERANRAGADCIVCLGDYVKKRNTKDELRVIWPMLKTLKAPGGVFFINGNHEHWADHALSLRLLEESGSSLRHRHAVIRKGGAAVALAGCGDARGGDEPGLDEALDRVPDGMFTILLAHNPDAADLPRKKPVDLFLCGHTHGGQIVVPVIDYPVMIPVDNKLYDSGLKHNARREAVFISRGIGWGVAPVRLNCTPEIAIIQLVSKKGSRLARAAR